MMTRSKTKQFLSPDIYGALPKEHFERRPRDFFEGMPQGAPYAFYLFCEKTDFAAIRQSLIQEGLANPSEDDTYAIIKELTKLFMQSKEWKELERKYRDIQRLKKIEKLKVTRSSPKC